jgi:hypothetical protein
VVVDSSSASAGSMPGIERPHAAATPGRWPPGVESPFPAWDGLPRGASACSSRGAVSVPEAPSSDQHNLSHSTLAIRGTRALFQACSAQPCHGCREETGLPGSPLARRP